jgi:CO dehydrogenase/acetyl-CoA synthase gamma subunit (corrinoid Fe-S protein)
MLIICFIVDIPKTIAPPPLNETISPIANIRKIDIESNENSANFIIYIIPMMNNIKVNINRVVAKNSLAII